MKKNGKTTVFLLIGFVFLARRLASLIERVIRFWNTFLVCVVSGVCETGYRNWEILIIIWKKTRIFIDGFLGKLLKNEGLLFGVPVSYSVFSIRHVKSVSVRLFSFFGLFCLGLNSSLSFPGLWSYSVFSIRGVESVLFFFFFLFWVVVFGFKLQLILSWVVGGLGLLLLVVDVLHEPQIFITYNG